MADELTTRIPPELDETRLDKALATILGLTRSQARELVERGATVDGAVASASTRVPGGALVITGPPDFDQALVPEPVDFDVLYEDDQVVVVDKPSGLVVHPGAGRRVPTLASGLLHRYPEIEGVGSPGRWGLVHRLDRDTSGALVVARTADAYESLSGQIRRREVRRVYLALVEGIPASPTGTVDAPLGPDPDRPTRRALVPGGKPARTNFVVRQAFEARGCALLEIELETGRTHQIRVHLAAIGHPVVGDRVYGGRSSVSSPRIFLHASAIEFTHPTMGERIRFEAPLPGDLAETLHRLEAGQ